MKYAKVVFPVIENMSLIASLTSHAELFLRDLEERKERCDR